MQKKTIVVGFSSSNLKNKILKSAKQYNTECKGMKLNSSNINIEGPPTPIYIAEHLTPKARKLYFLGRELVKDKIFKHCWTANGKILLRKNDGSQIIVLTEEDQIIALRKESQK
ncbi:hypothetical protein JYU34_006949 [Plutella xylostella]|uniref:FP protein C-terminal domain-containing protein n=1 Tax=Plutella xylostella TaxID=51655 RepID=A0ABQ7QTC1_PLUXY|nr:hypothetical protein JYU34_006949 [Plutella xylostella]